MKHLPLARAGNIIVQSLGKEFLIYDLNTHKAYNLNETSSIVYQACDGKTTFDELEHQYQFTDDLIHLALAELQTNDLLDDYQSNHFNGLSRREAIKRVGLATMIALPVISALVAPQASQAQSAAPRLANGQICGSNTQCLSNQCGQNGFGPSCCSANDFASCTGSADCCSGVACTNNVCCQGVGRTCDTRVNQCCSGLTCVAAAGQTNGQCQ